MVIVVSCGWLVVTGAAVAAARVCARPASDSRRLTGGWLATINQLETRQGPRLFEGAFSIQLVPVFQDMVEQLP